MLETGNYPHGFLYVAVGKWLCNYTLASLAAQTGGFNERKRKAQAGELARSLCRSIGYSEGTLQHNGIHHGSEADFPCQATAIMPSYRIAAQKLSSCRKNGKKKPRWRPFLAPMQFICCIVLWRALGRLLPHCWSCGRAEKSSFFPCLFFFLLLLPPSPPPSARC